MKKTFFICLVLAAVVCSCNKMKQTLNHIYGYHTLKSYTVDGFDSLSIYKDSLGTDYYFYHTVDTYDNELDVCKISGSRNDGKSGSEGWTWRLSSDNDYLIVYSAGGPPVGTGPFGGKKLPTWEILGLYEGLKMQTTYNNKTYVIELE